MIKNIFYGFMRVHILYHATKQQICGIEIMEELQRHGYKVSPGTLYPLLHQMEKDGLLVSKEDTSSGRKKIYYKATKRVIMNSMRLKSK